VRQRIANAPHVTVASGGRDRLWDARSRADSDGQSRFEPYAAIDVPALDDDVELIAHELEHIIEQLDDIDLATAASRTNTGVMVAAKDQPVFETRRAIQVGLNVAQEVRRTDR
jgi:hypothetical protein